MISDLTDQRVQRFDAYRATLNDDERADLDVLLEHVCDTFRNQGKAFGIRMGKELVMALVDFMGSRSKGSQGGVK